jgi:hypothetical protein
MAHVASVLNSERLHVVLHLLGSWLRSLHCSPGEVQLCASVHAGALDDALAILLCDVGCGLSCNSKGALAGQRPAW